VFVVGIVLRVTRPLVVVDTFDLDSHMKVFGCSPGAPDGTQVNRRRREVTYKEGDLVLLRTKFPADLTSHKYLKLARRRIGPSWVTAVHPNTVELDVPDSLNGP
jgi:hypothetical protein